MVAPNTPFSPQDVGEYYGVRSHMYISYCQVLDVNEQYITVVSNRNGIVKINRDNKNTDFWGPYVVNLSPQELLIAQEKIQEYKAENL